MKKYIFTESQIKKIVDNEINNQINEQSEEEKLTINYGSKDFLKKKGIEGEDLTEKIMKYQKMIGCEQTGHMMDCIDIMYSKYKKDFDLWKSLIYKNKPIIDKIGDKIGGWLSKMAGVKPDPKSIY
jgi:hypothetical protein